MSNNKSMIHNFDRDWNDKFETIKRDPYKYILSKREYNKCYNRTKRAIFSSFLFSSYLYYSLRHKNELGLVRGLKLNQVFFLTTLPKALVVLLLSYPIGFCLFVNYEKKKLHNIAKIELMKFDESHFDRNNYKYTMFNTPVYEHEDSKYGQRKVLRSLFNYHQVPGYIRRLRESNKDIATEVPPKYDFTPEGQRKIDEKRINQVPYLLKY